MVDNKNVFSNMLWRFFERCGAQGVTLVVSVILARLLDPSVYGTVALVTVFTTFLQVFVDSGLGNALIQKKDADDVDFSTVFFFNIFMCTVLYICMYFAAPLIASFYNMPELVPIVRVVSLMLVISGVKNVQQAYVSKHMMFKKFFYSTIGGTIFAAIVGIAMAYLGFGVWALVAQMLVNLATGTVILWITIKWRPKFVFSFKRLKGLFSYGWKLLVSALLETGYNDLRQLIIGKFYSRSDLAFFDKGKHFPSLIVTNVNSSIDSVLFPVMSSSQDDKDKVRAMTRRAIKTSTYIMFPLMIGLAVCSKSIVTILLTEKWLPCVPFMIVYCITYAFYPIHTANLNAIKAMGRSDMFLKLEIIKKTIGILFVLVTMRHSVMAMAYSLIVTTFTSQIINAWPNKKLLNYSYIDQIKDMLPAMLISAVMGIIVILVQFLNINVIFILVIQVTLGGVIYIGLSKVFHLESFEYLLDFVKKLVKKK
ncbi:MAG: lipopolysaccharide biosynthesis protein [Ruminococcaceae bacterium]|nr:lipopolysaccharide biosynthesis protein [Oscillospiraceae bacterium]